MRTRELDDSAQGAKPFEPRRSWSPRPGPESEPALYQAQNLCDEERARFRSIAKESSAARAAARRGEGPSPIHPINTPALDPGDLMGQRPDNGLTSLSLFSGGGGLDLGYERAGFTHLASYEWLEPAAATLVKARPDWLVFGGNEGDVRHVDWTIYQGVDVLHGGPPCQPLSTAGRQKGAADPRDMMPEFTRAVLEARPKAFQMENVPALTQRKFNAYVDETILNPLRADYEISTAFLRAADFGVPQNRRRVFFVGIRRDLQRRFGFPPPTHRWDHLLQSPADPAAQLSLEDGDLRRTMGARAALGLPNQGFDRLAPTLRSTLNGPRNTTSILSSTAAQRVWSELGIWPNGVAEDRERARAFVAKNGHFRLSVADCAILQGFPDDWPFQGATYMSLGQVGNAVPPPLGYAVATALADLLQ